MMMEKNSLDNFNNLEVLARPEIWRDLMPRLITALTLYILVERASA